MFRPFFFFAPSTRDSVSHNFFSSRPPPSFTTLLWSKDINTLFPRSSSTSSFNLPIFNSCLFTLSRLIFTFSGIINVHCVLWINSKTVYYCSYESLKSSVVYFETFFLALLVVFPGAPAFFPFLFFFLNTICIFISFGIVALKQKSVPGSLFASTLLHGWKN